MLKISQGLSRDNSPPFWGSFLVVLTAPLPASFTPEGVTFPTLSLCWRGFWTKYSKKSFSTYVKERTAQQVALGHWERMLRGNIILRDKAMNLADWKKTIKNISQACFWLGPMQAEQMAEGTEQLVTALGHRGLQKEMGKLAILQPPGLLSPGELEQCW